MRRRDFIVGLASAAASPLPSRGQEARKRPIVGVVGAATPAAWTNWVAIFVQRLNYLGWNESRNLTIEYRWAEGRSERFAEIAAEFVRMDVDVIVTAASGDLAAKRATSVIPIIYILAADPVGTGLVASLAHPGGNATGLSIQSTDLAGKRLELLRQAVPSVRRVAILTNVNYPAAVIETAGVQEAAHTLGVEVEKLEIRRADDIGRAFNTFKGRVQGLYLPSDALVYTNRVQIVTSALEARLPMITVLREYVEAGGLMSYGPDYSDLFRRTADFVDKVLRGTKPSDIPVEQPTKFELAVNVKTAKLFGITIPETLLATADEVIQ
jgi:putative tryptophan/tyrosine transport system substrate-binding protein